MKKFKGLRHYLKQNPECVLAQAPGGSWMVAHCKTRKEPPKNIQPGAWNLGGNERRVHIMGTLGNFFDKRDHKILKELDRLIEEGIVIISMPDEEFKVQVALGTAKVRIAVYKAYAHKHNLDDEEVDGLFQTE
jgi:hypothetical protein